MRNFFPAFDNTCRDGPDVNLPDIPSVNVGLKLEKFVVIFPQTRPFLGVNGWRIFFLLFSNFVAPEVIITF